MDYKSWENLDENVDKHIQMHGEGGTYISKEIEKLLTKISVNCNVKEAVLKTVWFL